MASECDNDTWQELLYDTLQRAVMYVHVRIWVYMYGYVYVYVKVNNWQLPFGLPCKELPDNISN